MHEEVYIYTAGGNKGMIFHGLLRNLPIEVYFNNFESPIIIELPQMKDLIYNNDINIFIELLTNEQQWSNNGIFIAKNKMQMILATNKTIQNSTIPQTFKKFFPNLTNCI